MDGDLGLVGLVRARDGGMRDMVVAGECRRVCRTSCMRSIEAQREDKTLLSLT